MDNQLFLFLPVILLLLVFVGFCWFDIIRSESVRYLPKWAWMLICIITIPLGGILYLIIGRDR